MLVSEVMSRGLKTVTTETKMSEVVTMMCLYRLSGLPVVEADNKLVGIIAEKDVLHYLFPTIEDLMENIATINLDDMMGKYKDIVTLKVADLMHEKVVTVAPDMHILKATSVMVRNRFRRIPVAEGDQLVGMLSLGDVHKAIYQKNMAQ